MTDRLNSEQKQLNCLCARQMHAILALLNILAITYLKINQFHAEWVGLFAT